MHFPMLLIFFGNPQTFHPAFLIINLARLMPESVLYNAMPTFVFIGSNGAQQKLWEKDSNALNPFKAEKWHKCKPLYAISPC